MKNKASNLFNSIKGKIGKNYIYVIPSIASLCFIIFSILHIIFKLDTNELLDSKNFNDLLKTLITFVSINISFLGVLITILISNKDKISSLKYFMSKVDKWYFSTCLKSTIIAGFVSVLLSCLLLMNDVYLKAINIILISFLIWFILYYMASAYRFISLLLRLFLDDNGNKQVKNEMNREKEDALKARIKSSKEKHS